MRRAALSLATLSGLGAALCLPRPGLCVLAWFCLVPLFLVWAQSSPRASFAAGFSAGFGFHGLALYWIYSTCRFAGVAVPVAILAWGSLAAFLALHWGLVGWAGCRLAQPLRPAWRPWAWAIVWSGGAVFWERWTPRFGVDLLAYTQYRNLSLLQMGSVFGPHGLGFLIIAFNAALCASWREAQGEGETGTAPNLALISLLILGAWGWGAYQLGRRPSGGPSARVEILQPNIDQYQKWDEKFEKRIADELDELLARPRPESPALIVWPEASLPRLVEEGAPIPEAARWSRRLDSFQIVGAVTRIGGRMYNAALLVGPDGFVRGAYHKRELVPFGEYVPFPFLRRFIGILNQLGGITEGGPRQPLLETPLGLAAATICYEAVFPRWARLDASRGARLIVNITNDGWYKDTWGPYQHFEANVFRAIENRATIVRSGNTGISGVIDPWGVVTARLDLNERGRLDAQVPREDPFPARSFYARHGDWFGLLCLSLTVLLAFIRR